MPKLITAWLAAQCANALMLHGVASLATRKTADCYFYG